MVMVEIDNDFEIESKYHHKTVVLLLTAHISYQFTRCCFSEYVFSYTKATEYSDIVHLV